MSLALTELGIVAESQRGPMIQKYFFQDGEFSQVPSRYRKVFPNAVSRGRILYAWDVLEEKTESKWRFREARHFLEGNIHPGLEKRLEEIEAIFGQKQFTSENLYLLAPEKMWKKGIADDPVAFLDISAYNDDITVYWPIFAWDGPREIPLDWRPRITALYGKPGQSIARRLRPGFFEKRGLFP